MKRLEERITKKYNISGEVYQNNKNLIISSYIVDIVDLTFCPWESILAITPLAPIAKALDIIEYSMKVPFIIYYIANTRNLKPVPKWLIRETLALIIPFSDLLFDISPVYKNKVMKYLNKKEEKKLKKRN